MALVAVAALFLLVGGCSSGGSVGSTAASGGGAGESGMAESSSAAAPSSPAEATANVPASDRPFGNGCAALPPQGEGSIAGVADDPVANAAAHTPVLSRLVSAISAANLVDALNAQQDVTLLAPANQAFDAVPADNLRALGADTPQLTAVLTHHVIQGRLTPDRLAGTHTTLNNDELTIEFTGGAFTVAASGTLLGQRPARIICGNVQTANATVYVIDQLLAQPG